MPLSPLLATLPDFCFKAPGGDNPVPRPGVLGFIRVLGLGFRVLGFGVEGLGFSGLGFRTPIT